MNQCLKPRNREAGSNLVDMGRYAAHSTPPRQRWRGRLRSRLVQRWGGRGEGLRRSRGDAAGVELGASLTDRSHGERGNHPRGPPSGRRSQSRRWEGPLPTDGRWGGAEAS